MMQEEVDRLYEQARGLEPKARTAFVENACREVPQARNEILSLLEQADEAEAFFRSLRDSLPSSVPGYGSRDLSIGQAVGHYQIRGRIGAGGMGAVYRAHDTRLDREVALKFLPLDLTAHSSALERLLIEARAAAALEHPNVCTIHEVGESEDGRPFIAMALYEGETLQDRLSQGPLPPGEAIDIAAQVARGLKAAHARGIVHPDVKPGNVMLTVDGTAKLLDFGLARLAEVTPSPPGQTPGTLAYMSPEQARGDPLDHRTDLWSLGVVLYEMLTGVRPFRGGNDPALLQAILHEDPEPVTTRRPETPRALARVVERLLRKDPRERYGDAEELLAVLAVPIPRVGPWPAHVDARRIAAATVVVMAIATLLYSVRLAREPDWPPVTAGTATGAPAIAVLPFSVHGQGLEIWREGMVDLLSMGLDGAGGLRAINSRTLLARWNEAVGDEAVADLDLALGVARETRASYALVGSAVAAGPQIQLAVDVYDLGSGQPVGQAQVVGSPDSILALVDRLAIQTLAVVLQRDPDELPAVDLASVTTRSLPALKAYLDGEVRHRRSDFEGAIEAWERAAAADTLFALAYLGLAEAYAWEGANTDRAFDRFGRAYRLADRLPQHEATVLRARWSHWQGRLDGIPILEEVVRQRPDDAEAWYSLGEGYYHLPGAMRGPEEARLAFERAAELQPRSAPYRAHLVDLAFQEHPDSSRIARELEAYRRLAPQGDRTQAGRIALALGFGGRAERQRAFTTLDSLTPGAAFQVYLDLRHPRFASERETVYRAIEARLDDPRRRYSAWIRSRDLAVIDGRVREAIRTLGDPRVPAGVSYCAPISFVVHGIPVPEEVLEEAFACGPHRQLVDRRPSPRPLRRYLCGPTRQLEGTCRASFSGP